tara:strand:+ start:33 stop:407 length:375 start_codon:yes stop_codon:yes gene_type:complete
MSLRTQYKELSKEKKAKLEKQRLERTAKSKKKATTKKRKPFGKRLSDFAAVTGYDPIQSLLEGPTLPNIDTPDLASEVRSRVEQQKARIASSPKLFPMYYERANEGNFITVKTKIGRTKKTKLS